MAFATVVVGSIDTTGAAATASASPAAVSEKRSLGCGAGSVELRWTSAEPVQLVVYDGNTADASGYDARPAESGAHAYASGRHTLTWSFVDENGQAAQPESHAACVTYF